MKTLTQPLKWHGGKSYLAQRVVELMPPHLHYVEPYFGGGSVLLERNPCDDRLFGDAGCSEVVNDINGHLTNFWRVLQDDEAFDKFRRVVEAMPVSEIEWRTARDTAGPPTPRPDVQCAVRYFVRVRQSLAGRLKSFATLTRRRTRRRMNEQVSSWLTSVVGLPAVHNRLKRVLILNQPALQVIRRQDGRQTLFYLDPTYLPETRKSKSVYEFEMTEADHGELLDMIQSVQGKVILSGYRSRLYDERLQQWNRHDIPARNHAAGGSSKRTMTECL